MGGKIRKTLYLPDWVADLLDKEGGRYNGPGVVTASAIFNFCSLSDENKRAIIKKYRDREVDAAYCDTHATGQNAATPAQPDTNRGKIAKALRKDIIPPDAINRIIQPAKAADRDIAPRDVVNYIRKMWMDKDGSIKTNIKILSKEELAMINELRAALVPDDSVNRKKKKA